MKKSYLYDLVSAVNKSGVVGEQDSILVLLNKISLRLVTNVDGVSSNVIVSDFTGLGKDNLVSSVCNLVLPRGCYFHRVRLSPTSLDYMSVDFGWDGKVLHIEDPSSDLLICESFRTLASKSKRTSVITVTKGQKRFDIEIVGKPVMIVTSMKAVDNLDIEGQRRWDAFGLDGSLELNREVLKSYGLTLVLTKSELSAVKYVKSLKPLSVDVPFIKDISGSLPDAVVCNVSIRTLFKKLLDYIRGSAVLHNRKVATWFDYEYARLCFWKMSRSYGQTLGVGDKELLDVLKLTGRPMLVREIRPMVKHGKEWIYTRLNKLKEFGLIEESLSFDESANRDIAVYSLSNSFDGVSLPSCVELSGDVKSFEAFDLLLSKLDADREKLGLKPIFDSFRS